MLSWLAEKMIARNMKSIRDDPNDGRVYDNRYVLWGRIAWGKLREYEVYEDTEETRRLDEYLARAGKG